MSDRVEVICGSLRGKCDGEDGIVSNRLVNGPVDSRGGGFDDEERFHAWILRRVISG
jgi:hypothetical protein